MRYRRISYFFTAVSLGEPVMSISPRWDDMCLKHAWQSTPDNWDCLGSLPAATMIDFHVALRPYREDALIDTLNEVSDPRHSSHVFSTLHRSRVYTRVHLLWYRYSAHLSGEQVAELVSPHPDTFRLAVHGSSPTACLPLPSHMAAVI